MSTATPRYLHVANGTSVTMTLEAAGVPGEYSIWADPLHAGPVPAGLTDDELLEVRSRFLASDDQAETWGTSDAAVDPHNDMRRWRDVIAGHERYDELVLWFEHDLFDQLNLVQVLTWIRAHVPPSKPVALICIGSFPGRPNFKGLGELTIEELAPLLSTRAPVTGPQYALAERAWSAFRQPTPEALDALRHDDTSALPFLAPAITRLLEEYPWSADGLSRTERRLLAIANDGAIGLSKVFALINEDDRFYTITDGTLLETVTTLIDASPPLLVLDRRDASAHPFRASVNITEAGRSILARRLDRIEASGIDRWIGGVHLQGRAVWRWNDAAHRVERH
jgi:hypothetical protein